MWQGARAPLFPQLSVTPVHSGGNVNTWQLVRNAKGAPSSTPAQHTSGQGSLPGGISPAGFLDFGLGTHGPTDSHGPLHVPAGQPADTKTALLMSSDQVITRLATDTGPLLPALHRGRAGALLLLAQQPCRRSAIWGAEIQDVLFIFMQVARFLLLFSTVHVYDSGSHLQKGLP